MKQPIEDYIVDVGDVVYRYDGLHGEVVAVNRTSGNYDYPMMVTMYDGEICLYTLDGDFDLHDGPLGSHVFDLQFVRVETETDAAGPVVTVVTYKGVEFTKAELEAALAKFS